MRGCAHGILSTRLCMFLQGVPENVDIIAGGCKKFNEWLSEFKPHFLYFFCLLAALSVLL